MLSVPNIPVHVNYQVQPHMLRELHDNTVSCSYLPFCVLPPLLLARLYSLLILNKASHSKGFSQFSFHANQEQTFEYKALITLSFTVTCYQNTNRKVVITMDDKFFEYVPNPEQSEVKTTFRIGLPVELFRGPTEETPTEHHSFTASLDNLMSLKYFLKELYTYSNLINKASGANFAISQTLLEDLSEAQTLDEALQYIKEISPAIVGLDVKNGNLQLTGFTSAQNQEAAQVLLEYMVKAASAKAPKNINLRNLTIKAPENEKFTFRTWLIRLGWKGNDHKLERNSLYKNLDGNTAFCTPESKERWKANRKKS